MQLDKTIIEKFLANRCNAEEAALVHRFLKENPDWLQQYYRQDWEETATGEQLSGEQRSQLFESISGRIRSQKTSRIRYIQWAAAAAIAAIVLSLSLFRQEKRTMAPVQTASVEQPARSIAAATGWKFQKNATRRVMKLTLPDGSVTLLSPAASIRYKEAFEENKRDITLEGEALFEVAKDKKRPFTVYAGNLSTTALGTSFRIAAEAASVNIRLLTGQVVVRAAKPALPGWKADVYLQPGQQVQYDEASGIVKVSGKGPGSSPLIAGEPAKKQKLLFDNTPLPQVFDELAKQFHVTIQYNPEELNGLSFTGTIFHNDSIPVLLQAIARMNELSVTSLPEGFSIRK